MERSILTPEGLKVKSWPMFGSLDTIAKHSRSQHWEAAVSTGLQISNVSRKFGKKRLIYAEKHYFDYVPQKNNTEF